MMKIIKSKKGFTLIELLIVVAIIGVLATLLMANFVGVRQRARDAQRKSDVRQIQSALELYRSDNSTYPTVGAGNGNFPTSCGTGVSLESTDGKTTYMKIIPCDPSGTSVSYAYSGGGVSYSLIACLENASDSQADNPINAACSGKPASFTVTNP
jgi:general secretion pathway protein G